jgi:hypothetical protein
MILAFQTNHDLYFSGLQNLCGRIQFRTFIHSIRFKDLPLFGKSENYLPLVSNFFINKISSPIIYNTIDCLESLSLTKIQQQCQVPIFPIGPMHRVASASSSNVLEDRGLTLAAWHGLISKVVNQSFT